MYAKQNIRLYVAVPAPDIEENSSSSACNKSSNGVSARSIIDSVSTVDQEGSVTANDASTSPSVDADKVEDTASTAAGPGAGAAVTDGRAPGGLALTMTRGRPSFEYSAEMMDLWVEPPINAALRSHKQGASSRETRDQGQTLRTREG